MASQDCMLYMYRLLQFSEAEAVGSCNSEQGPFTEPICSAAFQLSPAQGWNFECRQPSLLSSTRFHHTSWPLVLSGEPERGSMQWTSVHTNWAFADQGTASGCADAGSLLDEPDPGCVQCLEVVACAHYVSTLCGYMSNLIIYLFFSLRA